ncbi:MAG: enoyl-CoA hydratase/isomerase family protein [Alphaproteobacteria bacterium]|nr:enoyl-CoA hydratase/isomerase family protein [Alphaproteobacteria bacterium]
MSVVLTDSPAPGVTRLTLNRPERRNALNPALRLALIDAVERALGDPATAALVLAGASGHFCSGGDIDSMEGLTAERARARMKSNHVLVAMLANAEKPIVAAVEGFAVGAGAGLALLADTIVLAEGGSIGFPFFRIGLIPDYGILYTLPRRVGAGPARQILLYARLLKGKAALECGLADELVADGTAGDRAVALASELAAMPPHAFALAKRQLALQPASLDAALEMEAMSQSLAFHTGEFAEGRAAFKEKRPPRFR